MRAAWYEHFGPAAEVFRLGELPPPTPAADEVLVRMKTSGVHPADVRKRAGALPSLLDDGPVIPHSDGAGVIEAVGRGVPASRVGERVWVYQAQHGRRFGTAADYLALDGRRAVPLSDAVTWEEGACLGIPLMTAHRCVFADGPVAGRTLLVTGGAGRVGHAAIQWAKHAGARVIATASRPADEEAAFAAGADAVVSHRQPGWSAAVLAATGGDKVDRVVEVEFGDNLPQVLPLIRTGGTLATYASTAVPEPRLPIRSMLDLDLTLRLVSVDEMPETAKQQAIADIDHALGAGRIQHRIGEVLPLAETARSHELVEAGRLRGCVVVALD